LSAIDQIVLGLKRSQSPAARAAKRIVNYLRGPSVPLLPPTVRRVLRPLYFLHFGVIVAVRNLLIFYRGPLFQSRCASFGRGVKLRGKLPFVMGPVEIHVGNDVSIGGNVSILSGYVLDERPRLILQDRSSLGWGVIVVINKEVLIEEDVFIPHDVRISDSDGHPREVDLRTANLPPDPRDVRPVRICRGAWIGNGSHIMKGVTIGEGAIIGANSVVISDIPPFALALGNPAEVLIRGFGRPSTAKRNPGRAAAEGEPQSKTEANATTDIQAT
jgi:acetyltransferase-like isoleucine patch superfamily enzyme